MVFSISDTHYSHHNIVKGTTAWRTDSFQVRVDNINMVVNEDNTLYHLGDWSFGGIQNIIQFREQLSVRDIRIILGNHDKPYSFDEIKTIMNKKSILKITV